LFKILGRAKLPISCNPANFFERLWRFASNFTKQTEYAPEKGDFLTVYDILFTIGN